MSALNKYIIQKKKSIFRKPPENFTQNDLVHFKEDINSEIQELHVAHFRNVVLFQQFLFLKWKLLKNYCIVPQLRGQHYHKAYIKRFLFSKRQVPEGLWIVDSWTKGYFHWLTDALPRLIVAEEFSDPSVPVLLPDYYFRVPYIKESLEIFQRQVISYGLHEALKIEHLIAPSQLQSCCFEPDSIKAVKKRFQKFDSFHPEKKRRIYISRRKALRRRVLNEDSLSQLLNLFSIETVVMEELSFTEQRHLMSSTELLISNHGAGLTNMMFMPEDSTIIELKSNSANINNCFFNLARALDLYYFYTINTSTSTDVQKADITVDLEALQQVLSSILK